MSVNYSDFRDGHEKCQKKVNTIIKLVIKMRK